MLTSKIESEALAREVSFDEDCMHVTLSDGRTISTPIAWFESLLFAKPEQRQNWRLIGDGEGIHWTDLDEDISVAGLLKGRR
jgi:hypothetical protein